MPTIDQWIGSEIRERRELAGMTQAELAAKVKGMANVTLGFIENGKQSITIKQLFKICELLDCEHFEILPDHDDIQKYQLKI